MLGVEGITEGDLVPYRYPSDEELERVGVTGIFLGYYLKWDAREQLTKVLTTDFQVNLDTADVGDTPHQEGTYTNYENLDGKFVGVHDYLKFLKFGFGRATDHASIDIRNERISREEAIELVRTYEGKVPRRYLEEYLEFVGMTEDEFYETLDSFTNKAIFVTDEHGRIVRDENGEVIMKISPAEPEPAPEPSRRRVIAVVDYGMGNLRSVERALAAIGERAVITSDHDALREAERIVLPGVGAFGVAMQRLRASGLAALLDELVRDEGKPLLGICLGMQLVCRASDEHGHHEGLGWIDATVRRFEFPADQRLRIPHIGWNDVAGRESSTVLPDRGVFYFVHSYYADCADPSDVAATCRLRHRVSPPASSATTSWPTQFHPEKSQDDGLALLRRFAALAAARWLWPEPCSRPA